MVSGISYQPSTVNNLKTESSFIKAILGEIPSEGQIRWGENVNISYFEQENQQLNKENTAIIMSKPKNTL